MQEQPEPVGLHRENNAASLRGFFGISRARTAATLLLALPAALLLVVFFVGPLLISLQESLRLDKSFPSLGHYGKFFGDLYYLMVLGAHRPVRSRRHDLCPDFGYPLAYALAEAQGRWKVLLLFIVVAPLLTNVVVRSVRLDDRPRRNRAWSTRCWAGSASIRSSSCTRGRRSRSP